MQIESASVYAGGCSGYGKGRPTSLSNGVDVNLSLCISRVCLDSLDLACGLGEDTVEAADDGDDLGRHDEGIAEVVLGEQALELWLIRFSDGSGPLSASRPNSLSLMGATLDLASARTA